MTELSFSCHNSPITIILLDEKSNFKMTACTIVKVIKLWSLAVHFLLLGDEGQTFKDKTSYLSLLSMQKMKYIEMVCEC